MMFIQFEIGLNRDDTILLLQVVPRTKTPQEILEEYERLNQEREERRLEQRTNPKVSHFWTGNPVVLTIYGTGKSAFNFEVAFILSFLSQAAASFRTEVD